MDMVIANWQISVHRSDDRRERLATRHAEQVNPTVRAAERISKARDYMQKREQVHNWFMLHGGH
ncbi:MAG: hypothetical protein ACR2M0_05690 [Chloroflexia bacterium]